MNKILLDNSIKDNQIVIDTDGDYEIEYFNGDILNHKIVIEDNVKANIFIYSSCDKIISNINFILNESSSLDIYKFYHNKNVLENVKIDLNGLNAKINYHFSNIGTCEEEYNIEINHNASNTESNICNRSIALNNCKMLFNIDSNLPKGCIDCVLNQETRILFQDENNCTIKPNMYIDEKDVEAKHASVIGKFNEEDIFYLMSRGISYNDAVKLLVKGNIFSNLMVNMEQRNKILEIINSYWR